MTPTLERSTENLPAGFAELEADARADGHLHMTRLAAEFAEMPGMFHAVFACRLDGRLAGVGAITDQPAPTSQPAWRMRRLYVHRKFRRRNVARSVVTARFWEAIGFAPVIGFAWSHQMRI
jgi:predicted acetyltransferase